MCTARPPTEHAHRPPPHNFRTTHKTLQKADPASPPMHIPVLDFAAPTLPGYHRQRVHVARVMPRRQTEAVFSCFKEAGESGHGQEMSANGECPGDDIPVFTHTAVPGLEIIPSLLPAAVQRTLLRRLLTRDLSCRAHKTNLDLHYRLPPETSLFRLPPEAVLAPLDLTMHNPSSATQVLNKKLRWMTLGGQYDWTKKEYPEKTPGDEVPFPADIKELTHGLFPQVKPQAAIMNLYSPGDTLAPHRDVSESSTAGLVSLSIGCSAVFMIGLDGAADDGLLALRVNSGDVLVMDGESRWAWHSVPKVIAGSCPDWLERWPSGENLATEWDGWMKRKRMNLNVRQMWD